LRKRGELLAQVQGVQSAIYHIDQTLALTGYIDGMRVQSGRRFANGELIALIGKGERAGNKSLPALTQYDFSAKGLAPSDDKLKAKVAWSVEECRKRLNARGA
jgi:hypothetical protein